MNFSMLGNFILSNLIYSIEYIQDTRKSQATAGYQQNSQNITRCPIMLSS